VFSPCSGKNSVGSSPRHAAYSSQPASLPARPHDDARLPPTRHLQERTEEQTSDVLGHLGDYGVSEGPQSVHPLGNPMSHSTHVGFSCPLAARSYSLPKDNRAAPLSVSDTGPSPCFW